MENPEVASEVVKESTFENHSDFLRHNINLIGLRGVKEFWKADLKEGVGDSRVSVAYNRAVEDARKEADRLVDRVVADLQNPETGEAMIDSLRKLFRGDITDTMNDFARIGRENPGVKDYLEERET